MSDMTIDVFAEQTFGKIALEKMKPVADGFRLYKAGWLGDGVYRELMEVTGAEFRVAKSGPNKGKLSIMVKGTDRTAFVTAVEMEQAT